MNDGVKINLLGNVFEVFSVRSKEEIAARLKAKIKHECVFIFPSLTADFSIDAYTKKKENVSEYYTAALIAAAFFIIKRGLPLAEIIFDTPDGKIEIVYTDDGFLRLKIKKCKLLLTSKTECSGCEVKYSDIELTKKFRAVHTEDISFFSKSRLSEFVMLDSLFPSAVVLSASKGKRLFMNSYSEFAACFTSNLLLYAVAAYNEMTSLRRSTVIFDMPEESLKFTVSPFFITAEVRAYILE